MINKKLVIIYILLIINIFAGCAENTDNSVSDMSSESTDKLSHVHDENASLCMDKVLFVAQMQEYSDTNIMYYLVVMNDGNIFTMENNHKLDNYEFFKKFGSLDAAAWSLAEKPENIGSLSQEDTEKLSEYISEINLDSDYYDYERDNMGILPDVIPSIYYYYRCYISDGAEKSAFRIMNGSDNEGAYYKTYDKNALSAFELITNNQIYIDWRNKF